VQDTSVSVRTAANHSTGLVKGMKALVISRTRRGRGNHPVDLWMGRENRFWEV